jgi:hypothetical protein
VHSFVYTYVDYYENGVIKPGLTESNQVRIRVYNRSQWVRFSVNGQTCAYSEEEVDGELNAVFDASNTAIIDLPSNCVSAVLRVNKYNVNYKIDLLNPSNNGTEVQSHFTIVTPMPGQHVYTIKYCQPG